MKTKQNYTVHWEGRLFTVSQRASAYRLHFPVWIGSNDGIPFEVWQALPRTTLGKIVFRRELEAAE